MNNILSRVVTGVIGSIVGGILGGFLWFIFGYFSLENFAVSRSVTDDKLGYAVAVVFGVFFGVVIGSIIGVSQLKSLKAVLLGGLIALLPVIYIVIAATLEGSVASFNTKEIISAVFTIIFPIISGCFISFIIGLLNNAFVKHFSSS
jgi:hypothetical protein